MVCLSNISVDTLHKGDTEDDDDEDDNNNTNNNNNNNKCVISVSCSVVTTGPSPKSVQDRECYLCRSLCVF